MTHTFRFPRAFTSTAAAWALALLTASAPLGAQAPRFDHVVRADFFAGFQGDADRLARGMARTEARLAEAPEDPEALVWHGSGLLFQASRAFARGDAATGGPLWGRGLSEMQRAVTLAPDHVGVRVARGAMLLETAPYVPPAMAAPLLRDGLADYERALALQESRFATLSAHSRTNLLFGLADGYARLGDTEKARAAFTRLAAQGGTTPRDTYARQWLDGAAPQDRPQCTGCHTD